MSDKFDYFVMLAEKRTGSNFLCSNLNQFNGITAHGEAYNPYFIGDTGREKLNGMTLEMREKDPVELLNRMKADPKIWWGSGSFQPMTHGHWRIFCRMKDAAKLF